MPNQPSDFLIPVLKLHLNLGSKHKVEACRIDAQIRNLASCNMAHQKPNVSAYPLGTALPDAPRYPIRCLASGTSRSPPAAMASPASRPLTPPRRRLGLHLSSHVHRLPWPAPALPQPCRAETPQPKLSCHKLVQGNPPPMTRNQRRGRQHSKPHHFAGLALIFPIGNEPIYFKPCQFYPCRYMPHLHCHVNIPPCMNLAMIILFSPYLKISQTGHMMLKICIAFVFVPF